MSEVTLLHTAFLLATAIKTEIVYNSSLGLKWEMVRETGWRQLWKYYTLHLHHEYLKFSNQEYITIKWWTTIGFCVLNNSLTCKWKTLNNKDSVRIHAGFF